MALPDNNARVVITVPLLTSAPVFNARRSGLTAGAAANYSSPGAATPYGVNHPGSQAATRVFRFTGDGSTVVFTLPTAATGVTYPTTVDASLTAANYLQAIFLVYAQFYQESAPTVYRRRGTDIGVAAGEAKVNGTTVTFGVAPAAGLIIEVIIPDTVATSIVQITGGALVANQWYNAKSFDFLTSGVAVTTVMPTGSTA